MADYKVPATVDINAPFINDLSADDIYWVAYADVDGTQSDPNPIWSADVMYTHFYKSGQNVFIDYRKYDMTTHNISALTYPYTAIFAYKTTLDDSGSLAIGFQSGFDKPNIISQIKNGNGTFLFYGTIASADSAGIIEDKNKWEDPENTDPTYNPDKPIGGENADIYPITSEDVWPGNLPYDPIGDDTNDPNHDRHKMVQPYLLTGNDVFTLGNIFWGDVDDADNFFKKLTELFNNGVVDPMSCIAGFIRLPFSGSLISTHGVSGGVEIHLGGIPVKSKIGSSLYEYAKAEGWITNRFVVIDYAFTMEQIGEVFGTYYDYEQTQFELYLPYVGQVSLNASDFVNSTNLNIRYIVDVYTGDLVCSVTNVKGSNRNRGKQLISPVQRYKGNCAQPVFYARGDTQGNTQNIFNGVLGGISSALSRNPIGIASAVGGALMSERIDAQSGGGFSSSGSSGWFDVQYPYLIIKRYVPMYPENWRATVGAEQYATFLVSSLSGFTKFHEIHCEIPRASDNEKSQIESILKSGVIL